MQQHLPPVRRSSTVSHGGSTVVLPPSAMSVPADLLSSAQPTKLKREVELACGYDGMQTMGDAHHMSIAWPSNRIKPCSKSWLSSSQSSVIIPVNITMFYLTLGTEGTNGRK
ncbi:uncharacterized protein LOC119365072 [Triticum dicoccoides]|uniref:uncharacterized protein LOC119365072 n=1 Tax=Triticum dicoccoides TaxID=85692 RepID=UPI00188F9AE3|nr:uncharacterized protein LOC119365072 [Triticum dicoccoides]